LEAARAARKTSLPPAVSAGQSFDVDLGQGSTLPHGAFEFGSLHFYRRQSIGSVQT
jgi:hypothetical protein